MASNVVMPQLGESVIEGTVGKWLKQAGDAVEQYESIMEVITDKVTTEIPAPASGTLLQILVPEGETVKAGTVLAVIGQPGEKVSAPSTPGSAGARDAAAGQTVAGPAPASGGAERNQEPAEATPTESTVKQETEQAHTVATTSPKDAKPKKGNGASMRLTPVVARMISEYNISQDELGAIEGTGEGGRVSKKDVENYLSTRGKAPPAQPEPELAPWEQPGSGDLFKPTDDSFGKVQSRARTPAKPAGPAAAPARAPAPAPGPVAGDELVPLSPMRRSIADHMVHSIQTAPHVTTIHEVDLSSVIEHMKAHQDDFTKQGAKLTYTPYFVQAVVYALRAVPMVNALFTDKGILMRHDVNVGIAVAIEDGLIVPVVRHADDKSLLGLARAVNDLAQRARDKKLAPEEVQGGTFTITNYGVFGSLFGTPIINQPQSAILGVGAVQKRAIVINDAIAIRPMLYLGLTFDHRLLDGAVGDRFMNTLKGFLEGYQAK